jgi:hypothetical protein
MLYNVVVLVMGDDGLLIASRYSLLFSWPISEHAEDYRYTYVLFRVDDNILVLIDNYPFLIANVKTDCK